MWPFRRNKRSAGITEASQALATARKNLKAVTLRNFEVTDVASALKTERERNGFAEAMEAIILQSKGPLNDSGR